MPTAFGVADELSCYYDAPGEPCNVHVEVRVAGHLDGQALRHATAAALAAQPRAMVRLARGGWWQRFAWEVPGQPDCEPLTTVAWADEGELTQARARFLAAAPPLRSSPPLRLLLAAGPREDRVILNAHHAALDGISCLDLLRSIARHYPAGQHRSTPDGPVPTGRAAAPPAGRAAAPPAGRAAAPPAGRAAAPPAGGPAAAARPAVPPRLRGPRPAPAARIAPDRAPGRARDLAGYGFRLLPGRAVPAGARDGRERAATVNDLLITALIVAIGRWNTAHGRPSGRIRITMPVSVRSPGEAPAAGNLSRLAAVSVPAPASGGDLGALVADVAAQTRAVKDRPGPQVDPVSMALAAAWCPPAVKRRLLRLALHTAGPWLCDTSLVSNLGVVADPPRFGTAPSAGMWFSTSAHMPRGLSVGAVTAGGRLHLCLRYRRALFSEPAAGRFAGLYAAALTDLTTQGGDGDR